MKKIKILFIIVLALLLSCGKSDNSIAPDPSSVFCKEITIAESFVNVQFMFLLDDKKRVQAISTTDNGNTETKTYVYNTDGTLKDFSNNSFTYAGTDLSLFKITEINGNYTNYYFSKGLCSGLFRQNGDETTSVLNTYNADGDCIKAEGTVQSLTSTDKETYTMEYLTDKVNPFPSQPEFIYVGSLYQLALCPFSHKHLLSKINRSWTVTDQNGSTTFNFTQSYTYTYDDKGRLKTMVHTGNSKNFYNFSYAQCL
jgi:YD repeat-containing protein